MHDSSPPSACHNELTTDPDDAQFVRDRVNAAFSLIANAVTELEKTPLNQDVDDWHNTMFGRRYDATVSDNQNIKSRFETLLELKDYNREDQTRSRVTDVRFYCTTKRIEKVGKVYRNKDRNIDYKVGEISSRFANCYDKKQPTLMITFTVSITQYSEIQICPWFLAYARGYNRKDLESLPTRTFTAASKIVIPIAARTKYTSIDVFSLMDKTIVHELTHTDHHIPVLSDLQPHAYGQHSSLAIQTRALTHFDTGFKNAKKKVDNYLQDQKQPDPATNADNNSLFAVGTWIISKGGGPIKSDGTFGRPQSTPKAKL